MHEPAARTPSEVVVGRVDVPRRSFRVRHPRWARLLLVLASVVGTLGALEIGVRLLCPRINFVGESRSLFQARKFGETFGYASNATGTSWGAEFVTDRYGFRNGPGGDAPERLSQPTVLIVGDSVPNGIGVEYQATLSSLLASRLSRRIVNTSVTGYAAVDYENVVHDFVLNNYRALNVERVVLFVTLNDLVGASADAIKSSLGERGGAQETTTTTLVKRVDAVLNFNSWLIGRSKLYLLLKSIAYDSSRQWFLADEARFHDDRLIEALLATLQSIERMLTSVEIPLTIVVTPYEYQLREPSEAHWYPQTRLREAFGRAGLRYVDLADEFRAAMRRDSLRSKDFFLFNDHCHLSERGHALVSDALARVLSEKSAGR